VKENGKWFCVQAQITPSNLNHESKNSFSSQRDPDGRIDCGTMDAMAASVHAYAFSGASPDRVFRFVASGVFGKAALTGGLSVQPGVCSFILSWRWAGLRYFFYFIRKLIFLRHQNIFPASAMHFHLANDEFRCNSTYQCSPGTFHFTIRTVFMILIHMFIIGVPISYLTSRHYSLVAK